jgi:superfamily II DNA or RNA helicase
MESDTLPPQFKDGDVVRLKSRPDRAGMIRGSSTLSAGEYWYTIFFGPGRISRHPQGDLEIDQIITDVRQLFIEGRFATRDALSKLYTHLRLVTSIRSQIYAIGASRTNFYTYQFKPLLKFLDSRNHRLLLADEVGLGKTIETGLILTELKQRKDLKRILIVPPAHLIPKWQLEMRNRYELDFDILDRRATLEFLRRYEEEGDETLLKGILSLQTLRSRSLMERWDSVAPNLDIVIFDEAGRLRNSGTRSHGVASLLIENSDAALLLTATPVQTGNEDLFNLLRLLDPEEFDNYELFQSRLRSNEPILESLRLLRHASSDLSRCLASLQNVEKTPLKNRFINNPMYKDVISRLKDTRSPSVMELIELQRDINTLNVFAQLINRTRKREAHETRPERKAFVVPVEPTQDEKEFYQLITDICKSEYGRRSDDTVTSFVATTRQRQVASCMVAMLDYYKNKFSKVLEDVENSDIKLDDFDMSPDDANEQQPSEMDLISNFDLWKERLTQNDSKLEKLFELLNNLEKEEPNRKVIIFSYFKKTLSYLNQKLRENNIRCELISGDVSTDPDDPEKDERAKRIDNFRTNQKIRVLLSSEVGSEGIDLQFAHVLINYDLPWNPMVVEQRIGRIDRIGQKSDKIIIFNLSMKGTIEDKILYRLYHRIGIFEKSIGDLEAILGEEIRQMTRDLFTRYLSEEEQEKRIEQAAEIIKRKQMELEEFEEAASALIGQDEFFMDEINRAKNNHLYIDGQELILYLKDFLRERYRECQIEETDNGRVYILTVTDELRTFVRSRIPYDDLGLRLFLNRSTRGTIKMTIDSELAQQDRKIDFLTFHHPLIRAITSYYNEHPVELHPVSHVRLKTNICSAGIYTWFLYLLEITGARPIRDINVVMIPLENIEPLSEDISQRLFIEMAVKGEVVAPGERGLQDFPVDSHINLAENVFTQRLNHRFEQLKRHNNALVSNRLASLEESFTRNVNRREALLEKAKLLKRKGTYIKGLETGIRNLKARYEESKKVIESTRNMGRGYDLKGAGIVEVSHG